MNAALRPRPMRVLGLALLVFTLSFSVLVMHQVTHPGEGHRAGVTAHEHRGAGLVAEPAHAGHGGPGSAGSATEPAPPPGDHGSAMLHLCLGLIVTVAGLLVLHLLGWLRRAPTATGTGLGARLVRTVPRAPPLRLLDLDSLCVLRL